MLLLSRFPVGARATSGEAAALDRVSTVGSQVGAVTASAFEVDPGARLSDEVDQCCPTVLVRRVDDVIGCS
jgi:hypothetical protein